MGILTGILNTLLILTSLFLICLILIQRGKGGGLAGAFGGMGGSSAFGTKAGDVFTKVTMCVAAFWILLSMFLVVLSNRGEDSAWGSDSTSGTTRAAKGAPLGSKSKKSTRSGALPSPESVLPSETGGPSPSSLPAIPAPPDSSPSK